LLVDTGQQQYAAIETGRTSVESGRNLLLAGKMAKAYRRSVVVVITDNVGVSGAASAPDVSMIPGVCTEPANESVPRRQ
jgi:hypothetical protein